MSFKVFEKSPNYSKFSTCCENGFAPIKWETSSNVSMTAELHVRQECSSLSLSHLDEWSQAQVLLLERLPAVQVQPTLTPCYSLFSKCWLEEVSGPGRQEDGVREDRRKTVVEYCCLYVLDLCLKTKTENWYI